MTEKPPKLSESLEDYLETIFNLAKDDGVARAKDVASKLSVAKSSVTGALRLLSDRGLVNYRPYDVITLTPQGHSEAARVARKHKVLKSFFTDVMGIEPGLAGEAACKAEHALGSGIISRLVEFTHFANEPGQGASVAEQFHQFRGSKSRGTQ